MVKNVFGSFTILQKEFKKRRKHKILINKELNSILIILNGISEKLNNEYMLDNIKYDEIFENMTKLNNIHNELNKINSPILIKSLSEKHLTEINSKIENIKYLLHNIIKNSGAKKCSHVMQVFVAMNWYKKMSRPYISLFKLYNRLFVPLSANIQKKNHNDLLDDKTNLPYARKIPENNDDFVMSLHGAELVCPLTDKDIVIRGYFIIDPLTNISHESQMTTKYKKLLKRCNIITKSDEFYVNYLKQLSLRDFIVLSVDQIVNQINKDYDQLQELKKESLPGIIKKFLQSKLCDQHKIITLFLLDDNNSKFMAHIIFDMLYTDSALSTSSPYGSILYKNLHWSIQQSFKKNYSVVEDYKKKLNNLSTEKIPYETQIMQMKCSENIKAKALEKLKEINSARDGSITSKATKYLDGLLKIPFGVYKEEVIISFLDKFKTKVNNFMTNYLEENDTDLQIKPNSDGTFVKTGSDITNLLEKTKNEHMFAAIQQEWDDYNVKKVQYIKYVRQTLDECVYGHDNVKTQLERILGQWINGKSNGAVIGLLGPPGIGKTCIIKNGLSKCLVDENNNPRPFAFIPLGGATNGSFLDGHSYTYVGSTWGRIVDIVMETKCMNPIIFIDELDKVSNTEHGREIIGILTHLTDSTQNTDFADKYFAGIKFDLSKCLIVFTYNDASLVDRILRDRITTIELKSLSKKDKLVITNKYILPEILEVVGYKPEDIIFEPEAIGYIIDCYTYEAGVRKLKEKIFEIVREVNLIRMFDNSIKLPFTVDKEYISKLFSDKPKVQIKKISDKSMAGIVNGLYATAAGVGGLTIIQAFRTISESKELKLEFTGNQGDVMKESIKCARTIAWNIIPQEIKNKIKSDWDTNGTYGLHIHCPDTSTPKDGPSAGGAITLSIISRLCNIPVKNTVAMTGEIDLKGNITIIGGVHSKIEGEISAGATLVLLPEENRLDYEKIKDKLLVDGKDDEYRIEVKFIKTIYDILENALEDHNIVFKSEL